MTCVSNAKKPSQIKFFHQALIGHLDAQTLVQLHKMCCKMRAKPWQHSSKDHNDIAYKHRYSQLYFYHQLVQRALRDRGIATSTAWKIYNYRGAKLGYVDPFSRFVCDGFFDWASTRQLGRAQPTLSKLATKVYNIVNAEDASLIDNLDIIYPEHNDAFLARCIEQLKADNVRLVGKAFSQFELELAIRGS